MLILLFHGIADAQTRQDIEHWRAGGVASWGLGVWDLQLASLPGVPSCCPGYDGGTATLLGLSGVFEMPLHLSTWGALHLRAGLHDGRMETVERELVTADRDTVTAEIGHAIDVRQIAVGLEARIGYELFERFNLFGGGRFDLFPAGTYAQEERILSPQNIRFVGGDDVRMTHEGDLPTESLIGFSVLAGLRYDIPLKRDHSILLTPEAGVRLRLNDMITGREWSLREFTLGIGLVFVSQKPPISPSPLDPLPERLRHLSN